ncbi:hypothetical protein Ancab_034452 [Ancistrocladus abbreviatus]
MDNVSFTLSPYPIKTAPSSRLVGPNLARRASQSTIKSQYKSQSTRLDHKGLMPRLKKPRASTRTCICTSTGSGSTKQVGAACLLVLQWVKARDSLPRVCEKKATVAHDIIGSRHPYELDMQGKARERWS